MLSCLRHGAMSAAAKRAVQRVNVARTATLTAASAAASVHAATPLARHFRAARTQMQASATAAATSAAPAKNVPGMLTLDELKKLTQSQSTSHSGRGEGQVHGLSQTH